MQSQRPGMEEFPAAMAKETGHTVRVADSQSTKFAVTDD